MVDASWMSHWQTNAQTMVPHFRALLNVRYSSAGLLVWELKIHRT